MDMGRKLLGFDGSPDLCMGVITATFHASGKVRLDMDEFMRWIWGAMVNRQLLMANIGTPSTPTARDLN